MTTHANILRFSFTLALLANAFMACGVAAERPTASAATLNTQSITNATDALTSALFWGQIGDPGGYSVADVLKIARKCNPNWGTYAANHAAAHAGLMGAMAFPNPEFEMEGGRATARENDDSGNRPSRNTWGLALSQPIEMPGKRRARKIEAEAGFAVAAGEQAEFSAMLRADVIEAYYTVQYHAAQQRLWDSLLDVSEEFHEIAKQRTKLGDAGAIEQINAQIELFKARRESKTAKRKSAAARSALNALTGGQLGENFKLSEGFNAAPRSITLKQSMETALACHPRLLRLATELEQRYATIDKERTAWWPDLKITLRKAAEFDANSASIAAGFEIPLWNRNQGNTAKARAMAQKTYNDIIIAFNEIRRDVETAFQNCEAAREQIASYNEGLKSASEKALAMAAAQYREGAAGYLDVLTARRILQETEQGYIQSLYDAATARARLELAIGKQMPMEPAKGN
ncbi:MAG: TolC family protein [bacterium]|nr:TolC family protein [Candidatus Sumerlaeota bacterium]